MVLAATIVSVQTRSRPRKSSFITPREASALTPLSPFTTCSSSYLVTQATLSTSYSESSSRSGATSFSCLHSHKALHMLGLSNLFWTSAPEAKALYTPHPPEPTPGGMIKQAPFRDAIFILKLKILLDMLWVFSNSQNLSQKESERERWLAAQPPGYIFKLPRTHLTMTTLSWIRGYMYLDT